MLLVKDIIKELGCLTFAGNPDTLINDVIQLSAENQRDDVIFWCSNKNSDVLNSISHGTIICSNIALDKTIHPQCNLIIVDNPRYYFSKLIEKFFYAPPLRNTVSKTAVIHATASIGQNCFIGNHVVIEENCIIGDNCHIGHNTVIHYGTIINNNVKIGCNNTIGGFGYGYEKNITGQYEPLPHIGNVVIENDVEICNNSCIDRAALGSTLIKKNAKISNLVHIGHGTIIGENSLIIANAMIAGSVIIGDNVWVAPSASVINKITIGNGAIVGLSAVVIRPVKENTVVAGNPARKLKKKEISS